MGENKIVNQSFREVSISANEYSSSLDWLKY